MAMETVNTMNCLALLIIAVSSLISTFHFQIATANSLPPDIQRICDVTNNPRVCARSVLPYLTPGATVNGAKSILVMQVNAGISATQRALNKAKRALTDPAIIKSGYMVECVQVCIESYDSVMGSWKSALESIKAMKGFDVANHLTSVTAMVMSCEDAFTGGDPTVVSQTPLTKVDRLMLKMTSNALNLQKMVFP